MLVPIDLAARLNASAVVAEGRVISRECFKDERNLHLFTRNTVQVYKLFKGVLAGDTMEVITPGGVVGNVMERVSPSPQLRIGSAGIFICGGTPGSYKPVAGVQGYIPYNEDMASAADAALGSIPVLQLYQLLQDHVKQGYTERVPFSLPAQNNKTNAIGIASLSPLTISAGTKSRLTISGQGFGNTRGNGKVGFRNADDGGQSYTYPLDEQYKKWSDTEIIVEVPSKAGTGKIQVTGSGTATSSSVLTVTYARTNEEYENSVIAPTLVDLGGGGYVWQFNEAFAGNIPAVEAFKRAMVNWRCTSQVNWTVGENTQSDDSDMNGINTVRFDTRKELPPGALGITYTYYHSCNGVSNWFVSECDMLFTDTASWEFGPALATSKFDFESVCLHELGHALMLSHVINGNDLMHYALAPGVNTRTIAANNKSCADYVMDQSTSARPCGPEPMQPIVSMCNDVQAAYFGFTGIEPSPNPFSLDCRLTYELPYETMVELDIFDLYGRKLLSPVHGLQSKGKHMYILSAPAAGLAPGIYIAQINVDATISTRKLMVIKL